MTLYCIVAYVVDALVCIWYYPIMPGIPWDKAIQYLMLGVFQYVNWSNVFGTIATLFMVEILVHTMISINMLHKFLVASSKEH
ncbi:MULTISPECIES: hypothetical protein [Nostocales]|nr:hypothetical protein [Tolypothrix bouteillei]KAF3889343.1 hypothetical protein DA73_0400030600 [Tolypothrix bouteillei VB521301]